jgi:predicted dehydrogenase
VKKIYIIGAGQIGSRHLQALKLVNHPLDITVIDPAEKSLATAQQRYNDIRKRISTKRIAFRRTIANTNQVDIAIIATNSDTRKGVIQKLLSASKPQHVILEKILFQNKDDYEIVDKLLKERGTKAWVNCVMRMTPFFKDIKKWFANDKTVLYSVAGSKYGLVTNAIHYIDHIAFLTDCLNYTANAEGLDEKIIPSKRRGFKEINGRLITNFSNGSIGIFTCFSKGAMPITIDIFNNNFRCIIRQAENLAWTANKKNNWQWRQVKAIIPFQSQLTDKLITKLINTNTCDLPDYKTSAKLHLPYLEALRLFINKRSNRKINYYPFT